MMSSIFENAKFGDKFITRDGRKAIVINLASHFQGITMALTIEGDKDAFYRFYHEDGTAKKEAGDTDAVDIVGKWEEPIDEIELEKLAEDYSTHRPYDKRWSEWLACKNAYIAGYRKAKEE